MMLRRYSWNLRAGTHFTRRLSSSSSSPATEGPEKEEESKSSSLFSSWVGKIKGVFQSKAPSPTGPFETLNNLTACADELKKLARMANLASCVKLRPDLTQQAFVKNLEKCSTIYRALGKHNATGENVDAKQKALAAEECGCTIQEIDKALANFEVFKMLGAKILQMRDNGEEFPKSPEGVEKIVKGMLAENRPPPNRSPELGRNAPCSCGSGKKFKRCCGRGT